MQEGSAFVAWGNGHGPLFASSIGGGGGGGGGGGTFHPFSWMPRNTPQQNMPKTATHFTNFRGFGLAGQIWSLLKT